MAGFERQLDALYHADAMDVDSDIRVMETMLRRDGGSVERRTLGWAVRRWPRRRICKGGRYVLPASSGCTGSTARKAFYKRPASLPVSCSMRRWVPKQKACRRSSLCLRRSMILLFLLSPTGNFLPVAAESTQKCHLKPKVSRLPLCMQELHPKSRRSRELAVSYSRCRYVGS